VLSKNFRTDFQHWKSIVQQFDINYLRVQPDPTSCSVGQVINHVIIESKWYFSQAEKALNVSENDDKSKNEMISRWFRQNSFPDQRFKGPKEMDEPTQPTPPEELLQKTDDLR